MFRHSYVDPRPISGSDVPFVVPLHISIPVMVSRIPTVMFPCSCISFFANAIFTEVE